MLQLIVVHATQSHRHCWYECCCMSVARHEIVSMLIIKEMQQLGNSNIANLFVCIVSQASKLVISILTLLQHNK